MAVITLTLLVIRVVDLQAIQGEFYRQVSEQNRQFRVNLPAERGVFLDRFNSPLVVNLRQYFRYDDPLAVYAPTTPIDQVEALRLKADAIAVGYELQRQYLRPFSMAHVLGYVSGVNQQDLVNDKQLLLADAVGRVGLEQHFDQSLRGRTGFLEFEINALGEKQAVQREATGVSGQSLTTTLDPYLSTVAWRAMGNQSGAVVILDADTGEVLALVSTPSYDNNLFSQLNRETDAERRSVLQQALTDERQLFFNRASSGAYPPGSTFKLVTAIAGLENNAFGLDTTVDDQGVLEAGGQQFANWYYTQYGGVEGLISLVRALTRSNDTFFYKAAEWTGIEALAQKAREFGFGALTGIETTNERAGLVPDPTWKEKTLGERWFLGNTYHLGIGQGDLLVTPLQLAQMFAAFGNDGRLCKSTLLKDTTAPKNNCSSLGIAETNLEAVQEGMIGACSAGGTAFPFFSWNARRVQLPDNLTPAEQIRRGVVACKTGTSEFGAADSRGFRRTHGLFGMVIGGIPSLLAEELDELDRQSTTNTLATGSASAEAVNEATVDLNQERQAWLEQIAEHDFPETLAIVILVESDENQPYAEGSREAAPVARAILAWLMGDTTLDVPIDPNFESE